MDKVFFKTITNTVICIHLVHSMTHPFFPVPYHAPSTGITCVGRAWGGFVVLFLFLFLCLGCLFFSSSGSNSSPHLAQPESLSTQTSPQALPIDKYLNWLPHLIYTYPLGKSKFLLSTWMLSPHHLLPSDSERRLI